MGSPNLSTVARAPAAGNSDVATLTGIEGAAGGKGDDLLIGDADANTFNFGNGWDMTSSSAAARRPTSWTCRASSAAHVEEVFADSQLRIYRQGENTLVAYGSFEYKEPPSVVGSTLGRFAAAFFPTPFILSKFVSLLAADGYDVSGVAPDALTPAQLDGIGTRRCRPGRAPRAWTLPGSLSALPICRGCCSASAARTA